MPRPRRVKSQAKVGAMKSNLAITAWRTAARELGYLTKGAFKPIPPKGSPEHTAIKERQAIVLERLKAEMPPETEQKQEAEEQQEDGESTKPEEAPKKATKPKKPKAKAEPKPKKASKPRKKKELAPVPLTRQPRYANSNLPVMPEYYVMCMSNLSHPTPCLRLPDTLRNVVQSNTTPVPQERLG